MADQDRIIAQLTEALAAAEKCAESAEARVRDLKLALGARGRELEAENSRLDSDFEAAAFCPQCGIGVPFDEDGCCGQCGATVCAMSDVRALLRERGLHIVTAAGWRR